jgi:2-polyprenyl-3-methyl-5-hydroxy-6-metoxy-1,4-benzoquinol methylase
MTRWLLILLFLSAAGPILAQDPPDLPPSDPPLPPGLTVYEGRRIAQTMHFLGAEWLIRESRENEERCSLLLANLGIKLGMTVCDMGCGNGFYSVPIAKMIGPNGKVLAVDIQPEMLDLLKLRAEAAKVDNIVPVLGTLADPKLPAGQVDLILCVDVYHEFSHPVHMLAAMHKSLAPEGLVALVEFRGEDPTVPIKPEHKMTKAQILKEWSKNGFQLKKEFDGLPWQHLMFFGRGER